MPTVTELGLRGSAAIAFTLLFASAALADPEPAQPPASGGWGPVMMGPGHMGPDMMGRGPGGSPARHRLAMMGRIPRPYAAYRNPLPESGAVIDRGMTVFMENCESCHGQTGHGDGPAARGLKPPPADLAWLASMPMARWDPFMYWAIAEGGARFGTAMPAFKDRLKSDDIWAAITYIRTEIRRAPHLDGH